MFGLRPGRVMRTFDVPHGVLAFDDGWCRAAGGGRAGPGEDSLEEVQPSGAVAVVVVRGKSARLGDAGAGDPRCGDEADPVSVVTAMGGGLGHQGPDRVVAAQVAPDLLEAELR